MSEPCLLRNLFLVRPDKGTTDGSPCDLLLEGGRIAQIAPTGRLTDAPGRQHDAAGAFCLPGLIDCHSHTCGVFQPDLPTLTDITWIPAQLDLNLRAHLRSGVTTVRDMSAPLRTILRQRRRAEDPRSGFPRLLCAGPMLTSIGGYPRYVPRDRWWLRPLMGALRVDLRVPDDARRWVDRLAAAGVDVVKTSVCHRGLDREGLPLPLLPEPVLAALCDRAHRHGLKVAAHHYWFDDLQPLLASDIDALEHLTMDADLGEAELEKLLEKNMSVTTDLECLAFLSQGQHWLERDAAEVPIHRKALPGWRAILESLAAGGDPHPEIDLATVASTPAQKRRNLKALVDAGVLVGAATDAGTGIPFGSLPDEIRHMGRAGLTPAQALCAATSDAARVIGRDDIGRLEEGMSADLGLYRENPIESLEHLQTLEMVFRQGVRVHG